MERRRNGGELPDIPARIIGRSPEPGAPIIAALKSAKAPGNPSRGFLEAGLDQHLDWMSPSLRQVILECAEGVELVRRNERLRPRLDRRDPVDPEHSPSLLRRR